MHFQKVSKGDKSSYSVHEITPELPGLDNIADSHHTSKKGSTAKSKQASPSPKKEQRKELQAKIEEQDEDNDARLGKRASLSRTHKRDDLNPDDNELSKKLHAFLDRLKSDDRKDVESNAKMLARFIQHFSCNFSCDTSDIIKVMEEQKGDINIDAVRAAFVKSRQ